MKKKLLKYIAYDIVIDTTAPACLYMTSPNFMHIIIMKCAFSDDIYLLTLLYGVILKTIQVQLLRLIFKDQPKMTWHVMKMQMYINSSLKFSKIYELTAWFMCTEYMVSYKCKNSEINEMCTIY